MSPYRTVILLFCSLLFAIPLIAQSKANLAKLAAQLKDKEAAVRRSAVEAIGQLNDPAGVDPLIPMLSDDNQEVRSAAALMLGQMNATNAVEP
jgi:HEAT repeat protein